MRRPMLTAWVVLLVMLSHPSLANTDGHLTALLRSVDELIAAEAPADEAAVKAGALKHLARTGRHAPSDMLLHLAFLLERANRAPVLAEPELRREVLDHAAVMLEHIRCWQARGSTAPAQAEESVTPANDLCVDAIPLAEGTVSGTIAGAGADGTANCGSDTSPDVWYSFTATATVPMFFATQNSTFKPVFSVHSACPDAADDYILRCRGLFSNSWEEQIQHEMSAGETVWLRVAGKGSSESGSFDLGVDVVDSGITGTITRLDDGSAVSGASVQVFNGAYEYSWAPTHVQTAADGSYAFGPLPNGDWYVRVEAPNLVDQVWQDVDCFGCSTLSEGDSISLADSVASGIDFALPTGGAVSGGVTLEADGTPASAQVIAYSSAAQVVDSVVLEEDGTYILGGLPTDGVYLKAQGDTGLASEVWNGIDCVGTNCDPTAGSPLVVPDGSTATGVDFTLLRMGSIRGVVTRASDGQPLSATVDAYSSPYIGWSLEASAATDPTDGSYVLEGLWPQSYYLVARASGMVLELYRDLPCPNGSCPTQDATTVFPELGTEVTGIDFSLAELSTLTGRVTDDESGLPLDAQVLLWPQANSGLPQTMYQDTVDGFYEFTDLPPIDYRIHVRDLYSPSVYEDQAYDDIGCEPTCHSHLGDLYTLPLGATARLDFALDRCSADSHLVLDDPLSAPAAYEACRVIEVSDAVSGSGSLTLRAGRSIRFANGFSLGSGVGLAVEIDPDVASQ